MCDSCEAVYFRHVILIQVIKLTFIFSFPLYMTRVISSKCSQTPSSGEPTNLSLYAEIFVLSL